MTEDVGDEASAIGPWPGAQPGLPLQPLPGLPPGPPPGWRPSSGGSFGYGTPPGAPGWGEYKPGVIPLRPLGVGEILDGAFSAIRRNPGATLGLSALVAAVTQLLVFGIQVATRSSTGAAGLVELPVFLLRQAAIFVLTAVLIVVVSEAVLGRPISIGAVWLRVRPRIWAILAASVLVTVLVVVSLIAFIVGSVVTYVFLALTVPCVTLEGGGVIAALRRSAGLVRGAWWRTLGILLLAELIVLVISGIVGAVLGAIFVGSTGGVTGLTSASGLSVAGLAATALIGVLSGTLTWPIQAGISALIYVDRRMRVEGLDVTLAQTARGEGSGGGVRG